MKDNVKEWLYNLNCLYNNIYNALDSHINLYANSKEMSSSLLSNVDAVFTSYILVYTNSFMDEWNLDVGVDVIEIRKVCKPVFKYIYKRWPNIKILRNNVLAHNHRDNENKSIHYSNEWIKYKVPMNNIEVELLVYLLGLVIEAINKHFKFNYNAISGLKVSEKQDFISMDELEAKEIKFEIKNQLNELMRVLHEVKSNN